MAFKAWLEEHASRPGNKDLFFFREHYMRYFDPPAGAHILDCGGFVGATAIHYAQLGHDVTSIEPAPTYAAQFERNVREKCPPRVAQRIRLVNSLVEEFGEQDAYDAACMTELLQFCPDPAVPVRVVHRALRDSGRAFVTVPARQRRHARWDITSAQLHGLMVSAGFATRMGAWVAERGMPQHIAYAFKGPWGDWPGAQL